MAVDQDDDHWPSLAPIRTSATPACLHACDTICKSNSNVEEGSLQDAYCGAPSSKSSSVTMRRAPFTAFSPSESNLTKAADTDTHLARQSSCCYSSKNSCVDFFSCFSCTKQTSASPRLQRRCTPTFMLRSITFLFPAGGFQSFYSSPTGKAAQFSTAFPPTLSTGKLQHYASPRTPANPQVSGKIQQFSSPRTPGSGPNLQCSSAPRTPASGKVQHFSGAIPSPRTPFGLGAASPMSSARRRKSSFTLFMPPATADKKKAADQQDEPTSPHVTCIGRVGRQTHCKKLCHKDMINPQAHCHDTIAKKSSKKPHPGSGSSTICQNTSRNEATKSSTELLTMEACKQKFGRNQLHNPYKIHGFGDHESSNANGPDQVVLDCNQGDDITPIANGHKYHEEFAAG